MTSDKFAQFIEFMPVGLRSTVASGPTRIDSKCETPTLDYIEISCVAYKSTKIEALTREDLSDYRPVLSK